jgi:hypothetical protein
MRWTSDMINGAPPNVTMLEAELDERSLLLPAYARESSFLPICLSPRMDLLLPVDAIESVVAAGDDDAAIEITARLPETGEAVCLCFSVEASMGVAVRSHLLRLVGAERAAAHLRGLARASARSGGAVAGAEFVECTHCSNPVPVTGLGPAQAAQVYCGTCGVLSVNTKHPGWAVPAKRSVFPPDRATERAIAQCAECGYFCAPRAYKVFYCFFFGYAAFSWGTAIRCPGCMVTKALVQLALNLPFLAGVPSALTNLGRIRRELAGKHEDSEGFAGLLNRATYAAAKDPRRALALFLELREPYEHAAALKYNIARCFIELRNLASATQWLLSSLADAPTFTPSLMLLLQCHKTLGEARAMAELALRYTAHLPEDHPYQVPGFGVTVEGAAGAAAAAGGGEQGDGEEEDGDHHHQSPAKGKSGYVQVPLEAASESEQTEHE